MNSIDQILVPQSILKETLIIFKEYGHEYLEVFAIWVGEEKRNTFKIKEVWFPKQNNTIISYYVPNIDVHNINVELNKKNYSVIAQLHTHPGYAFHSQIDDENAILTLTGSLSIVIPNYGFIPIKAIDKWAVYRLTNGKWILLSVNKVKKLFEIVK